jgi:hypothetical protein
MFYGFVYLWQVICHFIIIPYIVPSHHVVHELSNLLGRRNRPPLVVVNEWRLPMVRLRLLCVQRSSERCEPRATSCETNSPIRWLDDHMQVTHE